MRIGIQISSDLKHKTGVEEYIYQLIKQLAMLKESRKHRFFLYNRESLKWPLRFGWTQIRLSWEMIRNKPDVLFIPAHTFPFIHPKKLIIVIQGLEFEQVPRCYSFWQRKKLRFLTKRNVKKATKIIVPSECTKNDLIKYYKINPEKIFVVYHGVKKIENCPPAGEAGKLKIENSQKYILYLGIKHKRKNIDGLKKAYKILKEKYKIPHELILAGVNKYIDENKKWKVLRNAEIFVFPSFYEGFGFPVLEAQAAGVPVVASNVSGLPEILGDSALLVNPHKPEEIAEAVYKIIKNPELKQELIKKGQENIKRFSWQQCARETLKIITS